MSALVKVKAKFILNVSKECLANVTFPRKQLESNGVTINVIEESEAKVETKMALFRDNFPYNFLEDAFGIWTIKPSMLEECKAIIDRIFDNGKFTDKEKSFLDLYYKQKITDSTTIKKTLSISDAEYESLYASVKEKVGSAAINSELEQCFERDALDGKYGLGDIVVGMMELMEKEEK